MSVPGPSITVRKAAATSTKADAVVVGVAPSDGGIALVSGAAEVDAAFGGSLAATLESLGAKGKAEEVTLLPSGGNLAAPVLAAVGVGSSEPSPEALRRAAGAVVRRLTGKAGSVAFALTCGDATGVGALAEGALLGAYGYDRYRSQNGRPTPVTTLTLLTDQNRDKAVKAALTRAQAVARAVNLTRDWVNTAPSDLYPAAFADQAKAEAKRAKLEVEVLDHKALASGGYGGIVGVGQGSERPPRLVRVSYRPARAKKHLAFVGKGASPSTPAASRSSPTRA